MQRVDWEFKVPLRIAYRTRTRAQAVVVELREGECLGRGESLGVSYRGETPGSIVEQLSSLASALHAGLSREQLQEMLPPGGARNALDCALWDLEAKRKRRRAWQLAGVSEVHPLATTLTLGIDTPEAMSRAARAAVGYTWFKLKLLGDDDDLQRVIATREARPDAVLIVDANQSWSERQLHELTPPFANLGVRLIEQPFAVGQDEALADFESAIPFCADESCQTVAELSALREKYRYVNIKLDKTGGLTQALLLARQARAEGFSLMVGCMGGSSLSMAPAFVVGQLADIVDLDGPLLAKSDVAHPIRYEGSRMFAPDAETWG